MVQNLVRRCVFELCESTPLLDSYGHFHMHSPARRQGPFVRTFMVPRRPILVGKVSSRSTRMTIGSAATDAAVKTTFRPSTCFMASPEVVTALLQKNPMCKAFMSTNVPEVDGGFGPARGSVVSSDQNGRRSHNTRDLLTFHTGECIHTWLVS